MTAKIQVGHQGHHIVVTVNRDTQVVITPKEATHFIELMERAIEAAQAIDPSTTIH